MTSPASKPRAFGAPWKVKGGEIVDAAGNYVAWGYHEDFGALLEPIKPKVAKLIAVAPEMFDMLAELANMATSDAALFRDDSLAKPFYIVHAEKIRALLKKASGK